MYNIAVHMSGQSKVVFDCTVIFHDDRWPWTNMSVEHTARTAADKGYRVILPEDSCSTMSADWHRASVDYAMANIAAVTSTDDVIAAIRRRGG